MNESLNSDQVQPSQMKSDKLKSCRDEIDALDNEMLKLVSRRAQLAHEIGGLKDDGVIYRPEREAQVLRRLTELNAGPLSAEAVTNIFRSIMSNCRALEKELSVAFLGPLGTFSEEAANKQFGGLSAPIQCSSIDEVFRQVETGQANYGVVPVENSTEGAVGRTLDLLMQTNLKICGEIELAVHHNLLSKQVDISKVSKVYSHAQSLAQCHEWLNKNLQDVTRESVVSNAEAAKLASLNENTVAIASKRAADLFGLNILNENIEDDPKNTTRFLVLSQHDVAPSGKDKTSLVMTAKNIPGAMLSLLEPLAKHDVSMTKLETRPSKIGMWEYVFFVDIEGHHQSPKVAAAIKELESRALFLKMLGSYPVALI
ncbi:MAG TPA: prephenate dehydratase [Methylotenera sp.]|nr:prephenate dehydratase [Methylotenera sp.]